MGVAAGEVPRTFKPLLGLSTGRQSLRLRWLNVPLRWRIGVLVISGLLTIFGSFGLLGLLIAQEDMRRITDEHLAITRTTAAYIDSELRDQFREIDAAAKRMAASGGNAELGLQELVSQPEGFIENSFYIARDGGVLTAVADARLLEQLAEEPVPVQGSSRFISGVHQFGKQGRPGIILAAAAPGPDGSAAGVIGEVLDPTIGPLAEVTARANSFAKSGHAELVDQSGRVIAASRPQRVLRPAEHPDFFKPLLARHASSTGTTAPEPATVRQPSGPHVMSFVPLELAPWGLELGGTQSELSSQVVHWRNEVLLFGAVSLVIALVLVWFTTRSVASPVQELTAASRRIAAGDLLTPVEAKGGGEVRALAQAFDNMRSNLQHALAALAIEKSRYEGIVGSMADAVVTTDLQERITAFNDAAADLTGCPANEALGQHYRTVVRGTAAGQPTPILGDQANACSVIKETIKGDGDRDIVVATIRSPIHNQLDEVAGYVSVLRDISAEEQVNRLKDEFLSTVSHELRTPLGYVKGYASTLLLPDGLADEQTTKHCLNVIVEASDELTELVDNLLDMSKIGAGVLSVSPGPVAIPALVKAAIDRAEHRGSRHRFVRCVPRALPKVLADPHRIEQVFYNLVDNASKYSVEGSQIAVRARRQDGFLVLSVDDEGLGIPADELGIVFDRFQRGSKVRGQRIGGSGLGLAICKGIVEAHGGRIWAESPSPYARPGKGPGTIVSFTLPLAQRHATGSPSADNASDSHGRGIDRIMPWRVNRGARPPDAAARFAHSSSA